MTKKNEMLVVSIVAIIVVAVGILWGTGTGPFATTAPVQVDESGVPIVSGCAAEVTPDLNVIGYDAENPNTAITENFAYRKQGSILWATGTLGTEVTDLEAGKVYEIVPGIDKDNGIDNPYGKMFTHTVKCKEDEDVEVALYNDEVEGSVTSVFYNADDNAAAETFSVGVTQTVRVKYQAGSDEVFGNPYLDMPNVLVIKLNASEWDSPEKVYLEDGTELAKTSLPQRYGLEGLSATDFTEYAYSAPVIKDTALNVYMSLNPDDTNTPGSGGAAADGTAYLFAGTYFINEDGDIEVGVETEEGVDIAASDSVSTTLDFTA